MYLYILWYLSTAIIAFILPDRWVDWAWSNHQWHRRNANIQGTRPSSTSTRPVPWRRSELRKDEPWGIAVDGASSSQLGVPAKFVLRVRYFKITVWLNGFRRTIRFYLCFFNKVINNIVSFILKCEFDFSALYIMHNHERMFIRRSNKKVMHFNILFVIQPHVSSISSTYTNETLQNFPLPYTQRGYWKWILSMTLYYDVVILL